MHENNKSTNNVNNNNVHTSNNRLRCEQQTVMYK